jgi:hypothetical protein
MTLPMTEHEESIARAAQALQEALDRRDNGGDRGRRDASPVALSA